MVQELLLLLELLLELRVLVPGLLVWSILILILILLLGIFIAARTVRVSELFTSIRNAESVLNVCCEPTNTMFPYMLRISLVEEFAVSQVTVFDHVNMIKVSGKFVYHTVRFNYRRVAFIHSGCYLADDYFDFGISSL